VTAVAALSPGFADPVRDSQRCFRRLLDAMSRPGRIVEIDAAATPSAGLSPAAAALALTLADIDAPVWLGGTAAEAAAWIRFHTGAAVVADPRAALFAFADRGAIPDLRRLDAGTDEYPDRSTTLVVEVAHLDAGGPIALRGPGIEDVHRVAIDGPDAAFWRLRAELHELFPRGIDVVFTCGTRVLGLPRTTRAEV
jgi:alpha-D-ribose 1-methylphosphonate 5-triphosphate synthase subunit PhnH